MGCKEQTLNALEGRHIKRAHSKHPNQKFPAPSTREAKRYLRHIQVLHTSIHTQECIRNSRTAEFLKADVAPAAPQ